MVNPRSIMFPVEDAVKRGVRAQRVATFLSGLDVKKPWELIVRPFRRTRSNKQNAYLWAVPNKMIAELTGYEIEEVHEYLLGSFYGWKDKKRPKTPRNPAGIESVPARTTTTDENGKRSVLTTAKFMEYLDFIQRFAAIKLGIVIPDPDPMYDLNREPKEKAA